MVLFICFGLLVLYIYSISHTMWAMESAENQLSQWNLHAWTSQQMIERMISAPLSLLKCYHKHLLECLCNFTLALIHALEYNIVGSNLCACTHTHEYTWETISNILQYLNRFVTCNAHMYDTSWVRYEQACSWSQ